ncbi:MAG: mechanosensitive ion channel family protein, partial [Prevotella sp.]|nr:mechanosensitive ion channel family protein [Prevotella sp.]
MRNKLLLLIGLILLFTIPCDAVLKEKNLGNTLSILRSELTTYHKEQEKQSATLKQQNELVKNSILAVLAKSNQNALMLYSQRPDYVFDLAYACHEATDQFRNFQRNAKPFRNVIDQMDAEVSRYDSLIITLQTMPTS